MRFPSVCSLSVCSCSSMSVFLSVLLSFHSWYILILSYLTYGVIWKPEDACIPHSRIVESVPHSLGSRYLLCKQYIRSMYRYRSFILLSFAICDCCQCKYTSWLIQICDHIYSIVQWQIHIRFIYLNFSRATEIFFRSLDLLVHIPSPRIVSRSCQYSMLHRSCTLTLTLTPTLT